MSIKPLFSKSILKLSDINQTVTNITQRLKHDIHNELKRKGAIIGISGGIDSSVTLALTVKALGSDKVIGILMPEKDSSPDSKRLALKLATKFNVKTVEENMTASLKGFGCYERRDEAVKMAIPQFNPEKDKFKIELKQSIRNMKLPPVFYVTVYFANGTTESKILPAKAYSQIVAASNFKQRSRMSMLYYHAESRNYAVVGTPNLHEVKQGFFVKYGDGGADVMPIGHLFKTQVYELAAHLGVPDEIIERTPTTDTYTAEQTQEDFFFQLPFEIMDLVWYGWINGYPAEEVALTMEYPAEDIMAIYASFERKVKNTEYLRRPPIFY